MRVSSVFSYHRFVLVISLSFCNFAGFLYSSSNCHSRFIYLSVFNKEKNREQCKRLLNRCFFMQTTLEHKLSIEKTIISNFIPRVLSYSLQGTSRRRLWERIISSHDRPRIISQNAHQETVQLGGRILPFFRHHQRTLDVRQPMFLLLLSAEQLI